MKRMLENAKRNWKLGLPACLLPAFLFFYGMMEIYYNNADEFWFDLGTFLSVALPFLGICFAAALILGIFLPKKLAFYYYIVVFSIGLSMYVQGNILKSDFGLLNGETIQWALYQKENWISIAVWLLLISGVIAAAIWKKNLAVKVVSYLAYGLITMLLITLGTLTFTNASVTKKNAQNDTLTTKDQFALSTQGNMIVFVLDAMDCAYTDSFLFDMPEAAEKLNGFTYFHNTIGMYGYTQVAISHILTGRPYLNDVSFEQYLKEAYDQSPLIEALKRQNYEINLYGTLTAVAAKDYINNLERTAVTISDPLLFLRDYAKLALFRYAPQPAKQRFVVYSTVLDQYRKTGTENGPFPFGDDPQFYTDFVNSGLTIKADRPSFHFYHLFGAHPPYTMDENALYSQASLTNRQQIHGSWKIVLDYLDALKGMGLYDAASIVIMSDHGHDSMRAYPTLMVKQAGSTDPFTISEASVSYRNNLTATLVSLTGEDGSEYGETAFEVQEGNTVTRYSYLTLSQSERAKGYYYDLYEFATKDDKKALHSTGALYSSVSTFSQGGTPYALSTDLMATEFSSLSLMGWGADDKGIAYSIGSSAMLLLNIGKIPDQDLLVTFQMASTILWPAQIDLYLNEGQSYIGTATMAASSGEMQFLIPKEKVTTPSLLLDMRFQIPEGMDPLSASDTISFGWKSIRIEESSASLPAQEPAKKRMELLPPSLSSAQKTQSGYQLEPDGYVNGFWMTLPAGTYCVSIKGQQVSGLGLSISGAIGGERFEAEVNRVNVNDSEITAAFDVPAVATGINFYITNMSSEIIDIFHIYLESEE